MALQDQRRPQFGHAAAAETVKGTLALLDEQGIEGELIVRDVHEGRAEVVQMWGRPESVRRELRAEANGIDLVVPRSRMASRDARARRLAAASVCEA